MKKLTTEEWIEKAKLVHGVRYDYSKVRYIGTHKKVCIICPIHGEFWQTPKSHSKGIGCSKCGGSEKLTKEEFVEKAKLVHGDRYDYSQVCPPETLCVLASSPPAPAFVSRQPRQAATTLAAMLKRQCVFGRVKKNNSKINCIFAKLK